MVYADNNNTVTKQVFIWKVITWLYLIVLQNSQCCVPRVVKCASEHTINRCSFSLEIFWWKLFCSDFKAYKNLTNNFLPWNMKHLKQCVCLCVVPKENILLNGLWTEVWLRFFSSSFISVHYLHTEMDEYIEARITLHWKWIKTLKCNCFWLLSQAGNMFS